MRAAFAGLILLVAGMVFPPAATAQMRLGVVQNAVVVVDQEQLFTGSAYGQSIVQQLERDNAALAAENREIERSLADEELELTEQRATLPADEFRQKATAFDEKVVAIRRSQDEKVQALTRLGESEKQRFYQEVLPVLSQVAAQHGAQVVLDKRFVILSVESADLTDAVIALIDTTFTASTDNR